jgi:tetratricopeptide (TPR) repeat protein
MLPQEAGSFLRNLAFVALSALASAAVAGVDIDTLWEYDDPARSEVRYREALPLFEQALSEWTARAKPQQIHFARWSVARCLRSLGRFSEALPKQLALEQQDQAKGDVDGYVLEEIAELYDALGRRADARPYFARAAEALRRDADFAKSEPERLARLRAKGQESK